MYYNKGVCSGSLAYDPMKVADKVVLLTVKVKDDRINPKTDRREFFYPRFVVFGREAEKALEYLVKGQEVAIEYKIETKYKDEQFYQDHVAIHVEYGRKPDWVKDEEEDDDEELVELHDLDELDDLDFDE